MSVWTDLFGPPCTSPPVLSNWAVSPCISCPASESAFCMKAGTTPAQMWSVLVEESSSWPKTAVWFFRPAIGSYKVSTQQASWGNTVLSLWDLLHSWCTNISEGSFNQGLKSLWPGWHLCIFVVLAQASFSQGDFVDASLFRDDLEDTSPPSEAKYPVSSTPSPHFHCFLPWTGTLFHGTKWNQVQSSPSLVLTSYTVALSD